MSSPVTSPTAQFGVEYERQYGVHNFEMRDGKTASVVSQPNWEAFIESLGSASSLGEIALSPELITSPGDLSEIRSQKNVIEGRVDEVKERSADYPCTTIVLGTATFNSSSNGKTRPRPANSLLFIRNGDVLAHTNKQFSFSGLEKQLFTLRQADGHRTIDPQIAGIICSDILGEGGEDQTREHLAEGSDSPDQDTAIGNFTETVLLSSSWAVSSGISQMSEGLQPEARFRQSLESRVSRLFNRRPHIQELIVADRLPADASEIEGPLNAHFTREPR